MKAKEYLEKQEFNYDHFTKLTSTGISDDIDNIIQFAEDYHQAKLNLLNIPDVSQRSKLYFAFMEEYNALMGKSEHQILKEEVIVLLAKYSG